MSSLGRALSLAVTLFVKVKDCSLIIVSLGRGLDIRGVRPNVFDLIPYCFALIWASAIVFAISGAVTLLHCPTALSVSVGVSIKTSTGNMGYTDLPYNCM